MHRGDDTRWSAVQGFLGAIVLLSLVAALVACQALGLHSSVGNGGTRSTAGSSSATPPAAASASRRPSSTSPAQPATLPPSAATSTSAHEAAETVEAYLDALIGGRYAAAWQRLAVSSQALWGTQQQFAEERGAYYASAGATLDVSDPDNTPQTLATWIPSGFDGDRQRAYVVNVNHPRIQSNASREVLIAAPDSSGEWRIWIGR